MNHRPNLSKMSPAFFLSDNCKLLDVDLHGEHLMFSKLQRSLNKMNNIPKASIHYRYLTRVVEFAIVESLKNLTLHHSYTALG